MRIGTALVVCLLAGCSTDSFVTPSNDAAPGDDASVAPDTTAPPPPDGAVADASATDAVSVPDVAVTTFCDTESADDAGRNVSACADFDRATLGDGGWALVDLGAGSIGITNDPSPSPPNHLRAVLPVMGNAGSGTKRIEASVPLLPSAVLDVDVRGITTTLGPNQIVTYVSVTPNGNENALGAVHLVRTSLGFRLTATGGIPTLKDLPALGVLGAGWHHLRFVWTYQPMSVQLLLDGKSVITVAGFAIPDPAKIVFRVGAWNDTMQAADPSDELAFDSVVVRRP